MVALGFAMVGMGLWSFYLRWRHRLYSTRCFARCMVWMGPSGLLALLAGWTVTEVGRQPYTVYGLLRTLDSASPIALPAISASLTAFVVTYVFVFGAGCYYLLRMLRAAPTTLIQTQPAVTANAQGVRANPKSGGR